LKTVALSYDPVEGKTYSLFGNSGSTSGYYESVGKLADTILEIEPSIPMLLETLERYSSKKALLNKLKSKPIKDSLIITCMQLADESMKPFTQQTKVHLAKLSMKRLWDKRLATSREQYHLYMLEIELTNRLNTEAFSKADRKIALLPYCLQDFSVNCKASLKGYDYQCNHCSLKCFENQASKVLQKYNIEPYIWRGTDFRKLSVDTMKNSKHLAVFGIACIPELLWGMRKCRYYHIPVRGIPLNANRCIRWFGKFFPTSVDLAELEILLQT